MSSLAAGAKIGAEQTCEKPISWARWNKLFHTVGGPAGGAQ
jgi:hypothetical protein